MPRTLVLAAICCLPALAQKPFTAEDTVTIPAIGEVQPSPDGKTILFTVATVDLAGNRTTTRLMRIPSSGGDPQPVAGAQEGAGTVRWSPKGDRVAYIAGHAIWTLDLASGRPVRVCDYDRSNGFLSKSGNSLAWSPDGTTLAFAGTLLPAPAREDPIVITRLLYKGRTALADNRRTHLFVVPASGGTPRALTTGNFDEHSIDWGGDGREIVFLSNHEPDPDARLNYDIFAVTVQSGAIRQVTQTPGVEMEPQISPDGRWIGYTATKRNITTIDSVAEDAHAWVVPFAGGTAREVNGALDRRTGAVEWTPDSKSLVYIAGDHGSALVCTTPVAMQETTCGVGKGAQAAGPATARDGSLTFTMTDPRSPAEIFRLDQGASMPRRLTHVTEAFVASRELTTPQTIKFKSFDGSEIQGWLYPALHASGRVPLILDIHGGPHGGFGFGFSPQFQFYAGQGYDVLAINPRGSSGYGQKFSDGCVNDWGGGDYKDLMAGVDHTVATHSEIDPSRLYVTGASYGGFMTNWVITQTKRFRAAVAVASLSDMISFYATSLYQDLVHAEFDGFPWSGDNYATLWKWSPLAHVAKVATPTLFLHGESDNDVHITQAEQMYTALRERGIESVLVRYPREGHGFREPKHRVDSLTRTLAWFRAH